MFNSSPPVAAYMRQWTGSISISSDNGLSLVQRQAITCINAGLLSIGLPGTNFSEIRMGIIFIQENAFEIGVY